MTKKVTLVQINVYDKMVPLVSGYLEAYARSDPELECAYNFTKYTTTLKTPVQSLLFDLVEHDSDIYALSCYIWNMGLIKALLPSLLKIRPHSHFILGGPQVMHHASDYLFPQHENLVICNGEGERTFANYLRALTDPQPDLSRVRGLSFYRDGALINTEGEERIQTLDEIPSPFLAGLFDTSNYMSVIETNRGCPFRCGFCYWGAANNDRVFRFDDARIREDLSWISRNGVPTLSIADANWGITDRDLHLSRHIAECTQEFFAPMVVHFSAAKNSPERVAEITKIFKGAGLFSPQPISMQSLDQKTLETIDRENIKITAFEDLQQNLNSSEIGSYVELIWPLPGETLSSYKAGVSTLCERGAHTILTYSHALLHNTPLYNRKDELKLVTRPAPDSIAEADLVIQTAEVSASEFEDGMWFIYVVKALYNTRVLNALPRYLHKTGATTYADFYSVFVEYCRNNLQHPFSEFCAKSIEEAQYYFVTNYPTGYWLALHGERAAFEDLLYQFVSAQTWWDDENARALFEIDQLSKPFIYNNTPVTDPTFPLEYLTLHTTSNRNYLVEVPNRFTTALSQTINESPVFGVDTDNSSNTSTIFRINHNLNQHRYSTDQTLEARADYCSGVISRISTVLPEWSLEEVVI